MSDLDTGTTAPAPARAVAEPANDDADRGILDDLAALAPARLPTDEAHRTADEDEQRETVTINLGPHHPSTHGVLRLITELDGETVVSVRPVTGYLHTGIEKQAEQKTYWQAIPVLERADYLSYHHNELVFCRAAERLLDLEVPRKARWLRVLFCELQRMQSHFVWFGTSALDIGAMSPVFWAFAQRDRILELFEMTGGQRMHPHYFQVGGVQDDVPRGFYRKASEFLAEIADRVDEWDGLLTHNKIWTERTIGVGVMTADECLLYGVTGPRLRAAGLPWDLRKDMPYEAYGEFEFDIPTFTGGDVYDSYRIRIAEIRQSLDICRQVIDGMPEGPFIADDRKVVLPPRHELHTSMEAVIHHFKLVTHGFDVPAGEVYEAIESPRGELGCYLVADGGPKPFRVHLRAPSFANLGALDPISRGNLIADLVAILGSLDTVLGDVDR
jgi:NADH-quinone oxidoreductase subunit D